MAHPAAVARVLQRVAGTVREHELFLPGHTVLVAVSGGPDSTCLLHALAKLRRLLRIRLEVFHADHRLRSDSAADAAYVRRTAERLRLPFHLHVAASAPGPGDSIEEWARSERLSPMIRTMRDIGAERIALGHTRDDQAETVLLWALMGSGLDGVAGIRPLSGRFAHPLLDVSREEVEAFCRALRLRPRMDPTNRDLRFPRNALRLKGLPALERALGRGVKEPLARTADLLREDTDELRRQAEPAVNELIEEVPEGVSLPATGLLELPRSISSRVVRQAIFRCDRMATKEDIDAVIDLAGGRSGRRRDLSSGLKAARDRAYVVLSRPSP